MQTGGAKEEKRIKGGMVNLKQRLEREFRRQMKLLHIFIVILNLPIMFAVSMKPVYSPC